MLTWLIYNLIKLSLFLRSIKSVMYAMMENLQTRAIKPMSIKWKSVIYAQNAAVCSLFSWRGFASWLEMKWAQTHNYKRRDRYTVEWTSSGFILVLSFFTNPAWRNPKLTVLGTTVNKLLVDRILVESDVQCSCAK